MPPGSSALPRLRCLCATVRRAGRLLNRHYDEALRPAGLSTSQFELMMTMRYAGPCNQRRLAELLDTDQTTLSRNLRLLQRERWIEAVTSRKDSRLRIYTIAPLGLPVLAEAQRCWRRAHAEMERRLGEPMDRLWPVLDGILAAARQAPE